MLLNLIYQLEILATLSLFDTYFFMVFHSLTIVGNINYNYTNTILDGHIVCHFWQSFDNLFIYRTRVSMILIQFLVYKLILRYFRVQFQVACFGDQVIW